MHIDYILGRTFEDATDEDKNKAKRWHAKKELAEKKRPKKRGVSLGTRERIQYKQDQLKKNKKWISYERNLWSLGRVVYRAELITKKNW